MNFKSEILQEHPVSYERAVIDALPTELEDGIHCEIVKLIVDKIARCQYKPFPPTRGQSITLKSKDVTHLDMDYWNSKETTSKFDSISDTKRLVYLGKSRSRKDKTKECLAYAIVCILTLGLGAVPFLCLWKGSTDYVFVVTHKDDPFYKEYKTNADSGDMF
jgi:hypothetical protein